jgi:hypothetical protein
MTRTVPGVTHTPRPMADGVPARPVHPRGTTAPPTALSDAPGPTSAGPVGPGAPPVTPAPPPMSTALLTLTPWANGATSTTPAQPSAASVPITAPPTEVVPAVRSTRPVPYLVPRVTFPPTPPGAGPATPLAVTGPLRPAVLPTPTGALLCPLARLLVPPLDAAPVVTLITVATLAATVTPQTAPGVA